MVLSLFSGWGEASETQANTYPGEAGGQGPRVGQPGGEATRGQTEAEHMSGAMTRGQGREQHLW